MGVFARLLRRSGTTREERSTEAEATQAVAAAAAGAMDETPDAAARGGAGTPVGAPETAPSPPDDGGAIPKQRSAEQAAGSGAGEGART